MTLSSPDHIARAPTLRLNVAIGCSSIEVQAVITLTYKWAYDTSADRRPRSDSAAGKLFADRPGRMP